MAALRDAMLKLWRKKGYEKIATQMDAIENPKDHIRALLTTAVMSDDPIYGGYAAEPALRAWGRNDPIVAEVINKVDEARMSYLTSLFEKARTGDAATARATYAMFLGLHELHLNDAISNHPAVTAILDLLLGTEN